MYATGGGDGITERTAELAIIDDPYKNMEEADSATHRAKVEEWFNSVLTTRLAPGSPLILIQTRWSESDLAGVLREREDGYPWWHSNIPAPCEAGEGDGP